MKLIPFRLAYAKLAAAGQLVYIFYYLIGTLITIFHKFKLRYHLTPHITENHNSMIFHDTDNVQYELS